MTIDQYGHDESNEEADNQDDINDSADDGDKNMWPKILYEISCLDIMMYDNCQIMKEYRSPLTRRVMKRLITRMTSTIALMTVIRTCERKYCTKYRVLIL